MIVVIIYALVSIYLTSKLFQKHILIGILALALFFSLAIYFFQHLLLYIPSTSHPIQPSPIHLSHPKKTQQCTVTPLNTPSLPSTLP